MRASAATAPLALRVQRARTRRSKDRVRAQTARRASILRHKQPLPAKTLAPTLIRNLEVSSARVIQATRALWASAHPVRQGLTRPLRALLFAPIATPEHTRQLPADECMQCAANADSTTGSTGCECDAGYTGSGDTCTACTPGKFKANVGSAPCVDCVAGDYSAKSAAIICHDCPSDSHAEAGSIECVCNAGYTGEHESCSACQAGTYKASSGSAACANCPAGKYSAAAAAVDCDECSTDSISAAGSAECECDAGFSGSADACVACTAGTYKAAAGS